MSGTADARAGGGRGGESAPAGAAPDGAVQDGAPRRRRRPDAAEIARMLASPRCGARTRSGAPCRAPAVAGRERCRKHGGAKGSGAQTGNRNARQHGVYSAVQLARQRALAEFIRRCRETLREMEEVGSNNSR